MIRQVADEGLPFELVGCDTLYGRSAWRPRQLAAMKLTYMADVPAKHQGRAYSKPRVRSAKRAVAVCQLAAWGEIIWQRLRVRATEHGALNDEFSARQVWTTKGRSADCGGESPLRVVEGCCQHRA